MNLAGYQPNIDTENVGWFIIAPLVKLFIKW